MKRVLLAVAVASLLVGCSSTKMGTETTGSLAPINSQKLSTNFTRQGVKLEWDCAWGTGAFGLTDAMCSKGDIKSIEVTAYATSYGNSENNRENAFTVAEMKAKAKLRHFIYEDVSSTRTVNTIAKNVEKANDNIKSKIKADEVELSDNDADPNANVSVRENTNDTVRTLTESIRSQAQGILKGVYIKDEKIVDRQTVQVTIRWDKDSNRGSEQLQKLFR
jgi:uncharacterized protein YcfL